ncbi:MAG TPA: hypothetical protein VGP82_14255 [Ktedonobacterales bacterium]|nr:hypothetical protein [Ktedonobacterales bacterium]
MAMTIHGPSSGLDESEALLAQVAGYLDAEQSGQIPSALEQIWIVEIDTARVERLRLVLAQHVPGSAMSFERAGAPNMAKPHAFVAMPFSQEWGDTYFYGVQQPVHRLDLLCERIDQHAFTGDVLEQIKTKIASARVVAAEVTDKNPNVFLEVGTAWGKNRPTVLLVHDQTELPFDSRGTRCLSYDSIQHLEQILTKQFTRLRGADVI